MKYLFLIAIIGLSFSGCTAVEIQDKRDKSKFIIGMPDMFSYPVNEYTVEGNCVKFKDTVNKIGTTLRFCGTYFIRENLKNTKN